MRDQRRHMRRLVAIIIAGVLAIIGVLKNADTIDGPTAPQPEPVKAKRIVL